MARGTTIRAALLAAVLAWTGCAGEPARPRQVVCIVVDTLRADRLGAYGYAEHATSPQLDAWLERARLYEAAFASSPWTLPSVGSIVSGLWPSHHGAGRWARTGKERRLTLLAPEHVTLAERFRDAGFATAAIISNHFMRPDSGIEQGFGLYDFAPVTNESGRRADEVVRRSLEWIDAQGEKPYFLLIHIFDPHMNYDAPPPFRGRFSASIDTKLELPVADGRKLRREKASLSDADRGFIGAAYDEEIAFVDAQLGAFLDELERRAALAHTLVALTADHGEELFEHGSFEHGHALWNELIHVPLAFWGPGVQAGREATPVSLVDLAPTLLDAAGLPPLVPADGVSLWPNIVRGAALPTRPLYAEGLLTGPAQKAVIAWPEKLLWNARTGTWKRFDLASDPGEHHGAALDGATADQALQRAGVTLPKEAPADARDGTDAAAPIDAETRESLEKLGYLE
ncbi:MAG TPA: sulfatase [Myxococcota bacterium]|nr:sulfatase [Myxococcota bacterium]